MLPVRFVRNGLENWLEQPFGSLTRWSDFDSICDRVLGSGTHGGFCVDIRHQDDDLIIEAELPGVNKENIEITAEQNVLTISAKYNEEKKEEKENFSLRERKCGQVSRSFRLDATADTENVSANLTNGILTLRIPTKPEAKPKKIDVK